MRKMILAVVSNLLMIVIPLLGNPKLILDWKILLMIFGSIAMWLTQPPVSVEETNEKQSSDRFSVILILAMSALGVIAPIIDWAYFLVDKNLVNWITFAGIITLLFGIFFRAWAVNSLGKFFTATVQIKDDHQLIQSGPYQIVRHPSYTGAFLAILATSLILNSWIGFFIAFIAMSYAYYVRIGIEEKELTGKFKERYIEYKKTTKMIIPYVW
ncbi:MAG: methyltransferase family protein [Bacteroidota bacterium]